jgi:hypothetical protein
MAKKRKSEKNDAPPCLLASIICEKVLLEKDEVLTPVRIVDTVTFAAGTEIEPGKVFELGLTLLLMFKSGEARGERQLRLALVNPSGTREDVGASQISFLDPPEGGQNIRIAVRLKWEKEGLYWFEVFLEETPMARVPLRVRIAQADEPTTPADK